MPSVFLVSDTHFGHKGVCHFTRKDGVTKLRPIYRALAKAEGKKMRVRFRGPRYDWMRLYCLKRNARAFSVYFD